MSAPSGKSPFGGGSFVLTLYGFDQQAHDALTRRWQTWFEANFAHLVWGAAAGTHANLLIALFESRPRPGVVGFQIASP